MARKSNEQQEKPLLALAAEAEGARVALLRGAIRRLEVGERIGGELEKLVLYLDAASDDRGSQAFHQTLMRRFSWPRRTLARRLDALRAAGLIASGRRLGGAWNRVDWARIRGLAYSAAGEVGRPSGSPQTVGGPPTSEPQSGTTHVPQWHDTRATVAHGMCHSGTCKDRDKLVTKSPPPVAIEMAPAWRQAEEELGKFGIVFARRCCASARTAGCVPEFVLQCLAFASANRQRWDDAARALYARLQFARLDQRPDDPSRWPSPSEAWLRQQRKAAAQQSHELRSQRVAAEQRARDDAEREFQAVEQQLGALLDSLREEDIEPLLAGADDYTRGLYRRQGRAAPFVRRFLLAALAERSGQEDSPALAIAAAHVTAGESRSREKVQ